MNLYIVNEKTMESEPLESVHLDRQQELLTFKVEDQTVDADEDGVDVQKHSTRAIAGPVSYSGVAIMPRLRLCMKRLA